jgi:hypothetical protein
MELIKYSRRNDSYEVCRYLTGKCLVLCSLFTYLLVCDRTTILNTCTTKRAISSSCYIAKEWDVKRKRTATLSPQQPAALDEADVMPAALPVAVQYTAVRDGSLFARGRHTTLKKNLRAVIMLKCASQVARPLWLSTHRPVQSAVHRAGTMVMFQLLWKCPVDVPSSYAKQIEFNSPVCMQLTRTMKQNIAYNSCRKTDQVR